MKTEVNGSGGVGFHCDFFISEDLFQIIGFCHERFAHLEVFFPGHLFIPAVGQ